MESRRLRSRDLALIALFAGLIAALGLPGTITVLGGQIPITAQTLGVMLAGSILGGRRGALAVLTFLVLVAAGMPLLAGGRGGLAAFAGLSAGFVLAWPLGAWACGWLTEHLVRKGRYTLPVGLIANTVGGVLVVYAVGVPFQAWRGNLGVLPSLTATAVLLPGDLLKVILTTLVARGVHAGYPTPAAIAARRTSRPARTRTGERAGGQTMEQVANHEDGQAIRPDPNRPEP